MTTFFLEKKHQIAGITVLLLAMYSEIYSQWSGDPLRNDQIYNSNQEEVDPVCVSDSKGGA